MYKLYNSKDGNDDWIDPEFSTLMKEMTKCEYLTPHHWESESRKKPADKLASHPKQQNRSQMAKPVQGHF